MQVFKVYFKVLRGTAAPLAINLCVFVGLAVLFSSTAPETDPGGFEPVRTPVTVINRDVDGEIARGLVDYLGGVFRLVDYPDDEEKLQDALFHRMVEYVVIIPPGFSDRFLSGQDCAIRKVIVPGSTSSHYVDISIDKFLNTVRLHHMYGRSRNYEASGAELVALAMDDLSVDVPALLKVADGRAGGDPPGHSYYYRYCAYALLAMVTMGVSSIMIAFNRPDLYLRNLCSPIPRRRINIELALGHGVFALGCWGILVALSFVLHGKTLLESGLAGLYALNTLVFALVCTAIGFVVGNFVRSVDAQAGAVNVIALGMSFLGGVFVPQSVMSKRVLTAAKLLPSYWFVRVNDAITEVSAFTPGKLSPVFNGMLVQLAFAAAIFSVALLLSKDRSVSSV